MNTLLLLFALPISTIILAIVLQKILKCPLLVAATFFAIYLIITYAVFDSSFLIYTIIYTILAYVTAILTRLICNILSNLNLNKNCSENCICEGQIRKATNYNVPLETNIANGTWSYRESSLPNQVDDKFIYLSDTNQFGKRNEIKNQCTCCNRRR